MKKISLTILVIGIFINAIKSQAYLSTSGGTLSGNLVLNGSLTGTYTPTVTGPYQVNAWNHNPLMSNSSLYSSLRLWTTVQPASTGNNSTSGIDCRIFNQQSSANSGGFFTPVSSSFSDQSGGVATNLHVMNYNATIGALPAGSNISYYTMYGSGNGPVALGGTITNYTGFDLSFPYSNATTNFYGVSINDITGATIARAYNSYVSAGAGKYGLYFSGTANNYLNGNLGIGTLTPSQKLEVTGNIQANGNVYIGNVSALGPINTSYLLNVAGSVRANQLTVNTTGADFVFKSTYNLLPLDKLELFIKSNHHLPGIEAAAAMQKEGVDVGEYQTRLLQKIEELTLYIISQDKQLQKKNKDMEDLKTLTQNLLQRMERIEGKN